MRSKKVLSFLLAAGMLATLVTGCSSNGSGKGEVSDSGEWTGEITFFAKEYTPSEPDEINPNPPTKLQEYADEYEEAHPGVTIKFVELPGDTVMNEYVMTQAAAKTMPDITFLNYDAIGTQISTDIFTPLNEYFEKEDPYVEGKTWGETFNDTVMEMMQKGNGNYYTVSGDYVETGIYYNARMFEEAGITETPENWEEFIDVCQKLKDAGFTPLAWSMAQDDTYSVSWTNRVFLSNCYVDQMDEIDVDGVAGINDMEKALALKNGVVSVDDGKYLSYFEALKDLVPYLNDSWASKSDLERKFMMEEVAMYWTGSWLPKKMADAEVDFEFGSFPFPTPTENTLPPYTTNAVTSGAVGGPTGSFQYCVSNADSNSTMSDEKLEVVMDWLMYITEPSRCSEIVNEYGSYCPTIEGSTPLPENEHMLDNLNGDYTIYDGGQGLTGTLSDTMFRNLHQYMLGEVTMDEVISTLSETVEQEVNIKIEENPDWDIDQYLK